MLKRILIAIAAAGLALCGMGPAYAACASGFIQITDPFLNPNGTPWSGSIVYTLAYNTTVAGATIVGARQQFNVTSGISICLAPGLYAPVVLNQGGFSSPITNSWGIPASGGPYTIAQIQGNITLQVPGVLMSRTVLTQAQVLLLNTTPQTFVPPPGAGFAVQPVSIIVTQTGSATYLTGDQAFNFSIGSDLVASLGCFKNVGGAGHATYVQSAGALDEDYFFGDGTLYSNIPLIGSTTTNPTGTGGNVIVVVYYNVVPLT
jgi:hypothetical protein